LNLSGIETAFELVGGVMNFSTLSMLTRFRTSTGRIPSTATAERFVSGCGGKSGRSDRVTAS
jgi:hypothetical protein